MHSLLEKLLQKKKIEIDGLSSEEKQTFDNWQKILSEGEVTVDKIRDFCAAQIGVIHSKWKQDPKDWEGNARLIPYHTVYSTLLTLLNSPKSEKENLEKYLNQLLN